MDKNKWYDAKIVQPTDNSDVLVVRAGRNTAQVGWFAPNGGWRVYWIYPDGEPTWNRFDYVNNVEFWQPYTYELPCGRSVR